MNTQKIKSLLIKSLGKKNAALIQGIRFYYLLDKRDSDPEIPLVKKLLKAGDVAVDVGANGGDWTYFLHQCVGDTGLVYAFEADPYYAMATTYTIKLKRMKGVQLLPFGLSESDERRSMCLVDANGLRSGGLGYVSPKGSASQESSEVVELKALDSLTESLPRLAEVSLIKCDVEGFELFVFKGAQKILEQGRPFVILEIGHYERQGYTPNDVYSFFQAKQYVAYTIIRNGKLARTGAKLEHSDAAGVNRVLVPKERLDSIRDFMSADDLSAQLEGKGTP